MYPQTYTEVTCPSCRKSRFLVPESPPGLCPSCALSLQIDDSSFFENTLEPFSPQGQEDFGSNFSTSIPITIPITSTRPQNTTPTSHTSGSQSPSSTLSMQYSNSPSYSAIRASTPRSRGSSFTINMDSSAFSSSASAGMSFANSPMILSRLSAMASPVSVIPFADLVSPSIRPNASIDISRVLFLASPEVTPPSTPHKLESPPKLDFLTSGLEFKALPRSSEASAMVEAPYLYNAILAHQKETLHDLLTHLQYLHLAIEQQASQGTLEKELTDPMRNPMRLAIGLNYPEVVFWLLSLKGNLIHVKIEDETPVIMAANHKNWPILEYLIKRPAYKDDGSHIDRQGHTVLMLACRANAPFQTIQKLIAKTLNINYKNQKGETALHLSCQAGSANILVELLLRAGANPAIRDKNYNTPLMVLCAQKNDTLLARKNGQATLLNLLQSLASFNINPKQYLALWNCKIETAYQQALRNHSHDYLAILEAYGATPKSMNDFKYHPPQIYIGPPPKLLLQSPLPCPILVHICHQNFNKPKEMLCYHCGSRYEYSSNKPNQMIFPSAQPQLIDAGQIPPNPAHVHQYIPHDQDSDKLKCRGCTAIFSYIKESYALP